MSDQRFDLLNEWLSKVLPHSHFKVTAIIGDASFRRYFRVQYGQESYIAMDAPPDKEDCRPFVAIARAFAKLNVQVPHIFAFDLEQGFLLLSDLGDNLYSNVLTADNVEQLYLKALADLTKIQACETIPNWDIPHFGKDFLEREWHLFQHWTVEKHWEKNLSVHEHYLLTDSFEILVNNSLSQPHVCVHRDYHSRNLLLLKDKAVGVLDFQDAVWGPITYDAVSLLRDCYIDWPREQIEKLIHVFYEQCSLKHTSRDQFIYWFDLMGIQRHLKAIGIFSRLKHLYNRPNYLQYIPRGLNYVLQISENYNELNQFRQFLLNVIPAKDAII